MTRYSKQQYEVKKTQAKEFRKMGYSYDEISALIGVPKDTIKKWESHHKWKELRDKESLTPTNITKIIEEIAFELKDSDNTELAEEKIKKLQNLVKIFELVTKANNNLPMILEALNGLTKYMLSNLQQFNSEDEKQNYASYLREVRQDMDNYISTLIK